MKVSRVGPATPLRRGAGILLAATLLASTEACVPLLQAVLRGAVDEELPPPSTRRSPATTSEYWSAPTRDWSRHERAQPVSMGPLAWTNGQSLAACSVIPAGASEVVPVSELGPGIVRAPHLGSMSLGFGGHPEDAVTALFAPFVLGHSAFPKALTGTETPSVFCGYSLFWDRSDPVAVSR